ncbi:uncharacterized protein DNG_03929 [Cephalotrichum gorgonifer]|uniref:Guanine nucleotide-exchange factor SEC12 n=1 Tax=Cephalotrichum gorgonifer TaxID=2041049 RepID=A0AAE8MXW8_9PEZI|nr:uncharacterized protein DNG_03929 [Cephalotrichum gorgonifer]
MAPPDFPSSKLTLSYPLFACDFDPLDANRLLVGGGGGPGRSGVGNKITVLNTTSPSELTTSGELDLGRDEDSVSCLAVSQQKRGKATTLVYAGVNSSPADLMAGKNEHLRVLALESTKARSTAGTSVPAAVVTEVSRSALFAATDPEEYQRLLRVGPPSASGTQLGIAASGLGKDYQIALFEASAAAGVAPKSRGRLELDRQADDVDVVQTGDETYQVAYCHAYELHVMDVGKGGVPTGEPRLIFATPTDHGTGAPKPVFRAIRYLTPTFLLAVSNLPGRKGAVLQAFRLSSKEGEETRLATSTRLPRNVAQATALAVRNLSPPATRGGKIARAQFVIAVAGHDSSISLYTLEQRDASGVDVLVDLLPVATLRDVHPLQITGLAFSNFAPPDKGAAAAAAGQFTARPQAVKLVSVSMGNTVVVHVVPLKKFIDRSVPLRKNGPPRPVRYVVAAEGRRPSSKPLVVALTIIVLVLALAGQVVLEATGSGRPVLGVRRYWNPYGTLRTPEDPFVNKVFEEVPLREGAGAVVVEEDGGARVGAEAGEEGKGWGEVGEEVFGGVAFDTVGGEDQRKGTEAAGGKKDELIDPSLRIRRAIHANDALLTRRILKSHPHLLHNPDTSPAGLSNSNLHLAALLGHTDVARVLLSLSHESPCPALNESHQTALMLAASAGSVDTVLLLAENDPSCVPRRDSRGRDAVMGAAQGGHDTVVQILLTWDPEGAAAAAARADADGNTALHFASSNGNLLVLRTLLAAGADPDRRNVWDWTAISYSATVAAEVYLKGLVAETQRKKAALREGKRGVRVVEGGGGG